MEHDAHTGFIVAAYAVTFLVIAAMILTTLVDHRALKRALRKFGDRGGHRE